MEIFRIIIDIIFRVQMDKLIKDKGEYILYFKARINKRIQRCSKCKRIGHNKTNKNCPANVDLTDLIEDEAVEAPMDIGDEATAET